MRLPYRWLTHRWLVFILVALVSALLLACLACPPLNGAHRWIPLGPVSIQPSELAKIVLVVFLAYMVERKGRMLNDWGSGLVPVLAVAGWLMGLVLIAPDFGTTVVMALVAGSVLLAAGVRWRYLLTVAGGAAVALGAFLLSASYRWDRIVAWVRLLWSSGPSRDPSAYHLEQSLVAVGSGGVSGSGLGLGQQKAFFLPEPFTDFIFAVIGEELGLIGCGAVLSVFLLLLWRGILAVRRSEDTFGAYLALGLTVLVVGQALVNMAVVVGLLPTKGLPLPFVSYGGSSLICTLMAMGLLLSVSRGRAT